MNQKPIEYLKLLWQRVFLFAMVDLLTSLIILTFFFLGGILIAYISQPLFILKLTYIRNAIIVLGLFYLIGVFLTSCWRHFSLIKIFIDYEEKKIVNNNNTAEKIEENSENNG